ncbi:hypothetical protein CR513_15135, partial [Mucuna pruriens]
MYQVKDSLLLRYYHSVQTALQRFNKKKVQHVPHANNFCVDALARLAITNVPPIVQSTSLRPTTYTKEGSPPPLEGHLQLSLGQADHGGTRAKGRQLLADNEGGMLTLRLQAHGPSITPPPKRCNTSRCCDPSRLGDGHPWIVPHGQRTSKIPTHQCRLLHKVITHKVTSVEHPQSNGQAEAADKGFWAKQLPSIIWAYHCSPQTSTRETFYRLTFGIDAMIPVKIGKPSLRRSSFDCGKNSSSLRTDLDLVEEATKEQACIRQEAYRQRATHKYNSKVRPRDLSEFDLVWRRMRDARKKKEEGKLAANWEGSFQIQEALDNNLFYLE